MRDGRVSDATALDRDDATHVFPASVPGTSEFTYVAVSSSGRRMIRLKSSVGQTDLSPADGHGVLFGTPGWLLWVKDGTLLADRRDADGKMERRERPLALETGVTRNGRGLFAASTDVLLHAPAAERPRRLIWMDLAGATTGAITDVGDYWQVRLSPDDRTAAVTARDPLLRSLDIHLMPVIGTAPPWRITTSLAADTDPVWSADGRQIAFRTMRRGKPEVFVTRGSPGVSSNDQDSPTPLNMPGEIPTDWRDGELLAQVRGGRGFDVVHVVQNTGRVTPVADSPFNETDARWSPDGQWITYVSDESGRPDIYVVRRAIAGGEEAAPQRVSIGGGTHPRWTADGRALLFLRGSTVMRVEVPRQGARLNPPLALFDTPGIRDFDVAHRGGQIAALVPAASEPVDSVAVVLNWRSLLPERTTQSSRSDRQR
jgi:hypothetical protein